MFDHVFIRTLKSLLGTYVFLSFFPHPHPPLPTCPNHTYLFKHSLSQKSALRWYLLKTPCFNQKWNSSSGNVGVVGLLEKRLVGKGPFCTYVSPHRRCQRPRRHGYSRHNSPLSLWEPRPPLPGCAEEIPWKGRELSDGFLGEIKPGWEWTFEQSRVSKPGRPEAPSD